MSIFPKELKDFIFEDSLVVFSPGRINLIGEFTDYNQGFVLPAAIDKGIYFVITPRSDQTIHLYSADFRERYETTVDTLVPSTTSS
ncbi:MAG: galactokinase family protein, partial [Chitinophagales bacterium]